MKITKSQLKQIIKEELQNVLLSEAPKYDLLSDNFKSEMWNEFARKYNGKWIEKDGMKAIYIPGIDGQPKLSPRPINDVGLRNKTTMNEGDITIVTDIPVSAGASSFDTDGDGDADKLDPDAVFNTLQADLPRLKALYGTQWTVEKTMEEFGDSPVGVTIAGPEAEEAFKARLKWALHNKSPKTEEEAERVFDEVYEWAEDKYEDH